MMGRSFGVAVAVLLVAGTFHALGSSDEDLQGVKENLNKFFDTFDDVISEEAYQIKKGKAQRDTVMNKKLIDLAEKAEGLEDEVYADSRKFKHHPNSKKEAREMRKMKAEAESLVSGTDGLLDEANSEDGRLKDELITLKYNAGEVLDSIYDAEEELKAHKHKKHHKKHSDDDEMMQGDDPSAALWLNPLSGKPVDNPKNAVTKDKATEPWWKKWNPFPSKTTTDTTTTTTDTTTTTTTTPNTTKDPSKTTTTTDTTTTTTTPTTTTTTTPTTTTTTTPTTTTTTPTTTTTTTPTTTTTTTTPTTTTTTTTPTTTTTTTTPTTTTTTTTPTTTTTTTTPTTTTTTTPTTTTTTPTTTTTTTTTKSTTTAKTTTPTTTTNKNKNPTTTTTTPSPGSKTTQKPGATTTTATTTTTTTTSPNGNKPPANKKATPNPSQPIPNPYQPNPNPYQPNPYQPNPNPNPNLNPYQPNPNPYQPNPNPYQPNPNPNPNPNPYQPNPNPNPNPNPYQPNPNPNPNPNPKPNPNPNPFPGNWNPNPNVPNPYAYNPANSPAFGRSNGQYFDTSGLEKYLMGCKDCVESTKSFQCPLNNEVLEMKKWANEVQEVLSFGCEKPKSCNEPGVCCISDRYPFKQTIVQMTQMLKDVYNMFQERCKTGCKEKFQRDPAWSPWAAWSACDKTCGNGVMERRRLCNNPAPANGQAYCTGKPMEMKACTLPDCCVDGNWATWTQWTGCSATCGSGMQERSRTCSNPPANSCGKPCVGSDKDMKPCNSNIPCCQDGDWSSWTTWSTCSATCGDGLRSRMRRCDSPTPNFCGKRCPGSSYDTIPCNSGPCCADPNWSTWGPWEGCSSSCGQGNEMRRRTCDKSGNTCGKECPGSNIDVRTCQNAAVVDGNWASWEQWSICSSTCGIGNQVRLRQCSNPPSNACGQPCPGMSFDSRNCTGPPCAPLCYDGNWGSWGSWEGCSASCGQGNQLRRRRCDNPPANNCGQPCPGSNIDMQTCTSSVPCCVNGNWGSWEPWSMCSSTCGQGNRVRSRRCDNPPNNNCGLPCPGPEREVGECQGPPCRLLCTDGNWGSWDSWEGCSATCGRGNELRRRVCNNPGPNFCGRDCDGSALDRRDCNRGDCCVNGNWGSWDNWEGCSSSCGRGNEIRRRRCDSPAANYCGQVCPGATLDLRPCNNGDCCIDGNWASWEQWSSCSSSCGAGRQERIRRCADPPNNACGRPCPGPEREGRDCTNGPCQPACRHGNWSSWSSWTPCSDSCGNGMRGRVRTCTNPAPNYCGNKCPGDEEDITECDKRAFIGSSVDGNWGQWTTWGSCSVSCGTGTKQRRRFCDNPSAGICGRTCPGSEFNTQVCNMGACQPTCINGNWGSWMSWSECSEQCEDGLRTRKRRCDNPAANFCGRDCPGSDTLTESCQNGDSQWSTWTRWSDCSVTCGAGFETRTRSCYDPTPLSCNGMRCPGDARETRRCDKANCRPTVFCIDGNWGVWASWSACSKTCGEGTRYRSRACDSPRRNQCGRDCPGSPNDEGRCNEGPCQACVDSTWGLWTSWTTCSAQCGPGTTTRSRKCQAGNSCGRPCDGRSQESKWCYEKPCATPSTTTTTTRAPCVQALWSSWEAWSSCSVTCEDGVKERSRRCVEPPFNSCGNRCPGSAYDRDVCRTNVACVTPGPLRAQCVPSSWGTWERWSSCSVTCGDGGVRERRRRCNAADRNACPDNRCPGTDRDRVGCRTNVPCKAPVTIPTRCIPSSWGTWERWSSCSATCGDGGVRERRRRCNVSDRNPCPGNRCPGTDRDRVRCRTNVPCTAPVVVPTRQRCIPSSWGTWERWSSCSVTCGDGGVRERRRRCNVADRNACPDNRCPGTDLDRVGCRANIPCKAAVVAPTRQRCIDGNWSDWSAWGPCSVTCGRGQRKYVRNCTNPAPNQCGKTCEGPDQVTRECQMRQCSSALVANDEPAWTRWGSWDPCSCQTGTRARSRACISRTSRGRLDARMCQGDEKEESRCDVRSVCPECIESCEDKKDGLFPSCASCSQYIRCVRGKEDRKDCGTGSEWDAFKDACVQGTSPSCTIVKCVDDCRGKDDGRYQSCGRCNSYVECRGGQLNQRQCSNPRAEYNHHSQRCETQRSPTCPRAQLAPFSSARTSIRTWRRQRDEAAPASGEEKESEYACVNKCTQAGRFHSCDGCHRYVLCTSAGLLIDRECPRKTQWDDRKKRCVKNSLTCPQL